MAHVQSPVPAFRFVRFLGPVAALLLAAQAGVAATITVAAGEVAVANNGVCSLREAIHNANADAQVDNTDCVAGSGTDTIELAANATYTLSDAEALLDDTGLETLSTPLVLDGNGATIERDSSLPCVLDGTHVDGVEFRILVISAGSPGITLNDLTLKNGCADGSGNSRDGGAIRINGVATLNRVTVEGSSALRFSGGLDSTNTAIAITDCTFMNNASGGGAGAIGHGHGGTITITGSTIANNTTAGQGGG
ncbi:MAG: hypothetical protein ACRD3J_30285, partial [Thermoanaerobaculia bacterium]